MFPEDFYVSMIFSFFTIHKNTSEIGTENNLSEFVKLCNFVKSLRIIFLFLDQILLFNYFKFLLRLSNFNYLIINLECKFHTTTAVNTSLNF